MLHLGEGEREGGVSNSGLVRNAERLFFHIGLALEDSNDETFKNFEGVGRVMMRLDPRPLHQRVASIEELADVAAIVLAQGKLATRVHLFITVELEDEIVEDEKREAGINTLIDLLGSVNHHLP